MMQDRDQHAVPTALEEAVEVATDKVECREKDVKTIQNFILGEDRDPAMPEEADETTRLLWELKAQEGEWTFMHLQYATTALDRAKADLDLAEQRVRDAKNDLNRVKDIGETIDHYKKRRDKGTWSLRSTHVSLREKVGMRDFERTSVSIEKAVKEIALAQQASDERVLPLPCVIGTSGQGKTEVLHAIFRDEGGIQKRMMAAYNEARAEQAVVTTLTLFVTFNQNTRYIHDVEKDMPVRALIGRLLARHFNAPWECTDTPTLSLDLPGVLQALSCDAGDKTLIVLLVDEVRKLGDSERRQLLDGICAALSESKFSRKFHLIPIVSCLDVNSLFTHVSTESHRPLAPIPLLPCPQNDLEQITAQYELFHFEQDRCAMYINLCGGHYGAIEGIVLHHRQSEYTYKIYINEYYIKAVICLLAEILQTPGLWCNELEKFDGKSLWELVSQNFGVTYKEVDTVHNAVRPAIAPFSLMCAGKRVPAIHHHSLPLFKRLHDLLLEPHTHNKSWEQAVPIAEALYCALTGALPPYLAGLEQVEPLVRVPAKDDYNIKIETYTGTKEEQRGQLKTALGVSQRGIYCPLHHSYPGIELAHRLYSVTFVTQNKMRKKETSRTMTDMIDKAAAEAAQLGQAGCITVIYATNADFERLPERVVKIGTAPYRTVYSEKKKVCFVRGEDVFEALEPLLGTVSQHIVKNAFAE